MKLVRIVAITAAVLSGCVAASAQQAAPAKAKPAAGDAPAFSLNASDEGGGKKKKKKASDGDAPKKPKSEKKAKASKEAEGDDE